MPGHLKISEKLLLAAYELVKEGRREFTAEDLVVAAWRKYPDAFGLSGYTDNAGKALHPDSNRVFAEIMGAKPIRKQGYLRKVGTKVYMLTETGTYRAEYLTSTDQVDAPPKASLPRELSAELRRLLASRALSKVRAGQVDEVTFYDACSFWGITPRSSAIELEGRLENFAKVVDRADGPLEWDTASFEHGGQTYNRDHLGELRSLNALLHRMFAAEISTIRKRTDERV